MFIAPTLEFESEVNIVQSPGIVLKTVLLTPEPLI